MIIIKTQDEIDVIREGGHKLAAVVDFVIEHVKPGISTWELDRLAEEKISELGGKPAFKGYKPSFSETAFPATLCTSINDELVHGIPGKDRVLKEGDILGIDIGMQYHGLFLDMARTVPVGNVSADAKKLLLVNQECLESVGDNLHAGDTVYKVGEIVQELAERANLSVIRDLVGHGVGKKIHEDPMIPNYKSNAAKKIKLEKGMVVAIEPMLATGDYRLVIKDDGWTYAMADGSLSSQFENTFIVNYDGSVENATPTKWKML